MNLTWIKYLPIMFTLLKESVELVESLRGPGNGADKKEEVLDFVRTVAVAFFAGKEETIVKWASVAIDVIVALYNAKGIFQKSQPAQA